LPRRPARRGRSSIACTARSPRSWRRPRRGFDSFGIDLGAEPPDAFAAFVRAEYAQMGEVIRTMGIKAE
jgi:hypothetical protein